MSVKKFFLPVNVRFGVGALGVLKEIADPADRVFVVTDPGLVTAGIADQVMILRIHRCPLSPSRRQRVRGPR